MRKRSSQPTLRFSHTYSEKQLAGLRASTTARKQETIERLRAAIASLKEKKQDITAQTIYAESGLHYSSFVRNAEALALFRANSTHLQKKKHQTSRKRRANDASNPAPRDPLMNYKKPQLVSRLREAELRLQDLERQRAALADAYLQRDARIVELEAKLTELEPYRNFVEQIRNRVRQEEHEGQF